MSSSETPESLWRNAQDNLIMAKGSAYSHDIFYNCQQVVDKSIKALARIRRISYARRHNAAIYIMRQIECPQDYIQTYKDLLDEYGARYSRICGAEEAPKDNPVDDTEEILKWVKDQLPPKIRKIGPSLK